MKKLLSVLTATLLSLSIAGYASAQSNNKVPPQPVEHQQDRDVNNKNDNNRPERKDDQKQDGKRPDRNNDNRGDQKQDNNRPAPKDDKRGDQKQDNRTDKKTGVQTIKKPTNRNNN